MIDLDSIFIGHNRPINLYPNGPETPDYTLNYDEWFKEQEPEYQQRILTARVQPR